MSSRGGVAVRWLIFALLLLSAMLAHTVARGQTPTPTCAGDLNADGYADGTDITLLAGQFGHAIPPAPAAYDLALPPDGYVDGTDITWLAGLFGQRCLGTLTADTGPAQAVTDGIPQPAIWGCTVSMPIWANDGAGVPMPGYIAIGSGW